ncbi:hypothetical protein FKM82_012496 [Ascaphus truei]
MYFIFQYSVLLLFFHSMFTPCIIFFNFCMLLYLSFYKMYYIFCIMVSNVFVYRVNFCKRCGQLG